MNKKDYLFSINNLMEGKLDSSCLENKCGEKIG